MKCEPFFSKYNLVRSTRKRANKIERNIFTLAAYVDKNYDEVELAKTLNISKNKVIENLKILKNKKIIKIYKKILIINLKIK